jgi:4-hydroxyphenylacetate 3-monooxygenase
MHHQIHPGDLEAFMIKTGAQHIASLRDGREVYLDGELVTDVTTHPAFRGAVASVGRMFDFHSAPENRDLMTFETDTGTRANRIWELPGSYEALVRRRRGLEAWTELHAGFMGRAPDHVASCIAGMYMGIEVFEAYDRERASALADYYRYARDNDLYLTYVIINPQADRSKSASGQADPYLTAGIVSRDADGITVRGAKMLATGGIMANEVFVTCIQPLQPGDEKYALSFAIPMNTKGLKILSRKSYEAAAGAVFDSPLASRFDENDAVLYFDDVKVPWNRVFIVEDIAMCQKQFHATPAHVYQNYQAMIRLSVKLRFLAGIAQRIAETNGIIGFPQVRETLGQLAAEVSMVEAFMVAMENKGQQRGAYFAPDRQMLYGAQTMTQQLYAKVINALRELAGGGMIMLPSSVKDFNNPDLARLIDKTQQSPAAGAVDKVKFYKLAWDAVGSEFASRHAQYEMFYAGATFVTKGHAFRTYDWQKSAALLDKMLSSYDLAGELTEDQKPASSSSGVA